MREEDLALMNSAMKLLQTVQSQIQTEKLDKAFWIELGMIYKTYQFMQETGHIPKPNES